MAAAASPPDLNRAARPGLAACFGVVLVMYINPEQFRAPVGVLARIVLGQGFSSGGAAQREEMACLGR